ncbi:MAG: hypothetical protein WCV81_02415 [Microgenomates group bacterium]
MPKTPEEIANECNTVRQSIIRIKTQALRKLCHHSINKELRNFLVR